MNGRRKVSLEAKKNRLRRRIIGALGESLGAISLLAAATVLGALFVYVYSTILSSPYFSIREISVRGVKS